MNNSDFNLTLQKYICDFHNIEPSPTARAYFESSANQELIPMISSYYSKILKDLPSKPRKCLTFNKEDLTFGDYHNFLLENNETLSLRTTKKSDKICPRVVGQAGYNVINEYFGDIFGSRISNQQDIKKLCLEYIDEIIPIFLDFVFVSDNNLWITKENGTLSHKFYPKSDRFNFVLYKGEFSFTKNLNDWNESNTLKYRGISLGEFQVHKKRTFKFRFNVKNLIAFLDEKIINNETLGISAELAVCNLFKLNYPEHLESRSSMSLVKKITPELKKAFLNIPNPKSYIGSTKGLKGKNSKSPHDFILEDDSTLSLKTNQGKMVCPPEVGQPSLDKFKYYFGKYMDDWMDPYKSIKKLVYENISTLIKVYFDYLFSSDYVLYVKLSESIYHILISKKEIDLKNFWDAKQFSFTKKTPNEWNESNTVKYKNISLGEFQIHRNRTGLKFRFNYENLLKIIGLIV
jgi:hypothetical protein